MPAAADALALRWLRRQGTRNLLRRVFFSRSGAAFLVIFALWFALVLSLVNVPPDSPPVAPGAVPQGAIEGLAVAFGLATFAVPYMTAVSLQASPSLSAILLPLPIDRPLFLREFLRRGLFVIGAALALNAAILGLAAPRFVAVSPPLFVLGFCAGAFPFLALLFLTSAGATVALRTTRRGLARPVLLAATILLLAGLPSITMLDGNLADDPLVVVGREPGLITLRLAIGQPLALHEVGVLAVMWLAVPLSLAFFTRYRPVLYQDYGLWSPGRSRQTSASRREGAGGRPNPFSRLRLRYFDVGGGWRAIAGRNLTLATRGAPLMVLVSVQFVLGAFVLVPLIAFPGGHDLLFEQIATGTLLLAFSALPMILGIEDAARPPDPLPLTPRQAAAGFLVPFAVLALPWPAILFGIALAMGANAGLAAAAFAFNASAVLLIGSVSLCSGAQPSTGGPLVRGLRAMRSAGLFMFAWVYCAFYEGFLLTIIPIFFGVDATIRAILATAAFNALLAGLWLTLALYFLRGAPSR